MAQKRLSEKMKPPDLLYPIVGGKTPVCREVFSGTINLGSHITGKLAIRKNVLVRIAYPPTRALIFVAEILQAGGHEVQAV